uniref:Uncharacterized protein n=1 Tax=Aegilops tauschii TaxID=37682 RepID=R7WA98_AEGTA
MKQQHRWTKRKLILSFAHKYRLGLWKPPAEARKGLKIARTCNHTCVVLPGFEDCNNTHNAAQACNPSSSVYDQKMKSQPHALEQIERVSKCMRKGYKSQIHTCRTVWASIADQVDASKS